MDSSPIERTDYWETLDYSGDIIVRLAESDIIPEGDTLIEVAEQLGFEALARILNEFDVPGSRLIYSLSPGEILELEEQARRNAEQPLPEDLLGSLTGEEIEQLQAEAARRQAEPLPSMTRYWRLETYEQPQESVDELVAYLNELPGQVELAYRELAVTLPQTGSLGVMDIPDQGYFRGGGEGVNAVAAWARFGADAPVGNVRFADVEQGWQVDHAEFDGKLDNALIPGHTPSPYVNAITHGTSVMGIIMAADNNHGVLGAAPGLGGALPDNQVFLSSTLDPPGNKDTGVANAIASAIAQSRLFPGDVLLLEVERGSGWPVELETADYHQIRWAIDLGVIVIEPAGNASSDLATLPDARLDITNPTYRDSGAIFVGACLSAPASSGFERWSSTDGGSNFGHRVNCFAWGEGVHTSKTPTSSDPSSYDDFSGTSAAAAIIAGAAILLQSLWRSTHFSNISPGVMRLWLSDQETGTHQSPADVVDGAIGVMPDLELILDKRGFP